MNQTVSGKRRTPKEGDLEELEGAGIEQMLRMEDDYTLEALLLPDYMGHKIPIAGLYHYSR